jgi:hypothetical protein
MMIMQNLEVTSNKLQRDHTVGSLFKNKMGLFHTTVTAMGWAYKATLALPPFLMYCVSPSDF